MEAYRDQYAKLFNSGRNVVVLAVSVDPDTALASWARDLQTPVLFGSARTTSASAAVSKHLGRTGLTCV